MNHATTQKVVPIKPLRNLEDLKGLVAIKYAQDRNAQGVVSTKSLAEDTGLTKTQLKKLVRKGWLRKTYVTGKNGGQELRFFINPDLRVAGPVDK